MCDPSPVQLRLAGLDGLRGIAVAAVVVFHLGYLRSGFLGVDIFFVLSGYLITGILVRELRTNGSIRMRRFTSRRLLRLYPALLVMVAFVLAVSVATHRAVRNSLHDAVAALTYTGNLVPLHGLLDHVWTLALEEQFYLVWPVLLAVSWRKDRFLVWPSLLLIAAALVIDLAHARTGALHSYTRAMGLPVGCALALSPALAAKIRSLGAGCLAILVFLLPIALPHQLTTDGPISIAVLLAAPAVAWLSVSRPLLLTNSLLQWLGTRSYSLYLWHFPLISLWLHHAPGSLPHVARVTAAATTSLIAAEFSFRLVERPVLSWRDRITHATRSTIAS